MGTTLIIDDRELAPLLSCTHLPTLERWTDELASQREYMRRSVGTTSTKNQTWFISMVALIHINSTSFGTRVTNTHLKHTLTAFDDFKNNKINVRSNVFWYVKVYSESVFSQLYIDVKKMLNKFPSSKINEKNALSVEFYSRCNFKVAVVPKMFPKIVHGLKHF